MPVPAVRFWTAACFVCGRDNPDGIRAQVVAGESGAVVLAELPNKLVGLPGILHGGIVVALLDEAMWYAVFGKTRIPSVTAHLEARFVRPAPPGQPLLAVARLEDVTPAAALEEGSPRRRRIGRVVARLLDRDGRIIAAARGRFSEIAPSQGDVHRLLHSEPLEEQALEQLMRWPGVEPFLKGGEPR